MVKDSQVKLLYTWMVLVLRDGKTSLETFNSSKCQYQVTRRNKKWEVVTCTFTNREHDFHSATNLAGYATGKFAKVCAKIFFFFTVSLIFLVMSFFKKNILIINHLKSMLVFDS